MKNLLLDISCLEMGLPPMSSTTEEVFCMIKSMPPERRRQINRKLKKVCKRLIAESLESTPVRLREDREKFFKKHLGFKRCDKLFNNSKIFTMRRITAARKFIEKSVDCD